MAAKKPVELSFDDRNARIHSERNHEDLNRSLRELGAGRSIVVDKTGKAIGGNATLEEAQKLGLKLKQVHTKGDELIVVVRDDLGPNDPKRHALALADNRVAEQAEWDNEVLASVLSELEDDFAAMESTGFTEDEVFRIISDDINFLGGGSSNGDEDPPAPPSGPDKPPTERKFQILVTLSDEDVQTDLLDELLDRDFDCRVLS
jgi:ParB-like chromosome segregation protein Spo0J